MSTEAVPADTVPTAGRAQALGHGVRTQLIRRPDRTGRQVRRPTVLIAGGPVGRRWLERRELDDPRALGELDPAAFADCAAPGFGAPAEAALLVCTHGRREVCCAKYGRPVAQALAARYGPLVWETTHVGGDRFAANLVVLPSGGTTAGSTPRRPCTSRSGPWTGGSTWTGTGVRRAFRRPPRRRSACCDVRWAWLRAQPCGISAN